MSSRISLVLLQLLSLCYFFAFGSTNNGLFSEKEIEVMGENLNRRSSLPKNLFIIGHRGMGESNFAYPQNTLASFKQAILLGADGIEFDIFESKDRQILVIHDDELWKNVYGADRSGDVLPENENQNTYRVSEKNISELTEMAVGPNGEKPPTIDELFQFIEEANAVRQRFKKPPIFLNIDMKSSSVTTKCIEVTENYLKGNPRSTIDFKNIYFTSSNIECLIDQKCKKNKDIQMVPQITTRQIYGENNVGKGYVIHDPRKVDLESLHGLFYKFQKFRFEGIDCVLWDVHPKLITFCKHNKLPMHLFASHFHRFDNYPKFASFIFYTTQQCDVFLKTDNISETISTLTNHSKSKLSLREKIGLRKALPFQKPTPLIHSRD